MYTLVPLFYRCFISNLLLIGRAVSEKKMLCLNIMVVYMYIATGWGQTSLRGPIFKNHKFLVYCQFLSVVSIQMTFFKCMGGLC